MAPLVITLDGPAGAGKSTIARLVAQALGLRFLDTGAMYRAIALKARHLGIRKPVEIARMIRETRITVDEKSVTLDGRDVTAEIRDPAVTEAVGPIADSPECRMELVQLQRGIGVGGGLVTEGRDQGSVVFPDATHKFYLDASIEVRTTRRWKQEKGDRDTIRRAIEQRDARDRARKVGPLVKPRGALMIDTSGLTPQGVVDRILAAVRVP